MVIDEETHFCPFRVTQYKGVRTSTLSDHNAILVQMEVPRVKSNTSEHHPKWIITPAGYQRMEELFNENCGKIDINQESQQLYNDFEKLTDNTLNKVFKRTDVNEYERRRPLRRLYSTSIK